MCSASFGLLAYLAPTLVSIPWEVESTLLYDVIKHFDKTKKNKNIEKLLVLPLISFSSFALTD